MSIKTYKTLVLITAVAVIFASFGIFCGCENSGGTVTSLETSSETSTSNITSTISNSSKEISTPESYYHSCPPIQSEYKYYQYKGRTLNILYNREFTKTEKDIVNAFLTQFGVKVKITVATPEEYPAKLAAMISGKDSPDVVVYNSNNFPGFAAKSLQSLATRTFYINDSKWDAEAIKAYSINGKVFGIVRKDSWQYEQDNLVTYYNTDTLSGLADPYSLYKQGKWNYEAATNIAQAVKNKGDGFNGMAFERLDAYMLSSGIDFISYNQKSYTNLLNDTNSFSKIQEAWQELSGLNQKGLITEYNIETVNLQNTALITAKAYGMSKDSGWFDGYKNKIKAVPVATKSGQPAYSVKQARVFGVAKGAKNIDLAAAFIYYFTDAENYKKDMFYNEELYKTYTELAINKKVIFPYAKGVVDFTTIGKHQELSKELMKATSSEQTTVLNHYKSIFNSNVKRANAQLKNAK